MPETRKSQGLQKVGPPLRNSVTSQNTGYFRETEVMIPEYEIQSTTTEQQLYYVFFCISFASIFLHVLFILLFLFLVFSLILFLFPSSPTFCLILTVVRSPNCLRLNQCFSTAGPQPGTGTWQQLYQAARHSPGLYN